MPPLALAFIGTAVAYLIYHYALGASQWGIWLGGEPREASEAHALGVYLQHIAGGLLFAATASSIVAISGGDLSALGLGLGTARGWWSVPAMLGIVLPVVGIQAGRPALWKYVPLVRTPGWTWGTIAANLGSWLIYLIGYELMFRGLLVMFAARWLGPEIAIAASTALYVFAHLPKHAGEAVGTLVAGPLFAGMVLYSGSVWTAIGAHFAIAVTSDLIAARSNPAIGFRLR